MHVYICVILFILSYLYLCTVEMKGDSAVSKGDNNN